MRRPARAVLRHAAMARSAPTKRWCVRAVRWVVVVLGALVVGPVLVTAGSTVQVRTDCHHPLSRGRHRRVLRRVRVFPLVGFLPICVAARGCGWQVATEVEVRAAFRNSGVSVVIMTADISLAEATDLRVENRELILRGDCGEVKCVLNAKNKGRHLYVNGASARLTVSRITFDNGRAQYQVTTGNGGYVHVRL